MKMSITVSFFFPPTLSFLCKRSVTRVPGSGSPWLRPSSLFFGPELRQFVKVIVVFLVCRGAAFRAVAGAAAGLFFGRHRERAAVLALVLEGA